MSDPGDSYRRSIRSLGVVLLGLGFLSSAPAGATRQSTAADDDRTPAAESKANRDWIGSDGSPLPFRTDEEVLRFLREGRIVEIGEELDGSTRPRRILLEHGGVRAHAVFRHVEVRQRRLELENGEVLQHFRDSYVGEVAAYELDRLFGLDAVPPTVIRRVGGRNGSLQLWIEAGFSILQRRESGREPPDWDAYNRQIRQMSVFDNLIHNVDRNQTNAVIDPRWRLWLVDHTRAFLRGRELYDPDRVVWVERDLWRRLRTTPDEEIRATLAPFLNRGEIQDLLSRRRSLVTLLDSRIRAAGEAEVVFDSRVRTR